MTMGLLRSEKVHYAPVTTNMDVAHTQAKTLAVRFSRAMLITTYVLVAVMACLVVWQLVVRSAERHVVSWAVAAIFVGIAVPLSLHEVYLHLLHWESPLQRYYCRILLMVPIYAIESWCALRFKQQALFFAVAREFYECLVIRDFFRLLMDALSGGTGDPAVIAAKFRALGKRDAHMLAPLCRVRPWRLDTPEFFVRTQLCVFQYVVVRFVMSLAVLIAELNGTFGEGSWHDPTVLFPYSVAIINASQFVAMYALVLFYHETAELLAPLNPLGKFLSVKAVVFLSFWQSILLSALVELRVLGASETYSEDEVASGLQQFIICIEMAGAAIAHHYTFSVTDFWAQRYKQGALAGPEGADAPVVNAAYGSSKGIGVAVAQLLPGDIMQEAGQHATTLRAAAAESVSATFAQSRAVRAQMLGRAPPVTTWSTSTQDGGGGAGEGVDRHLASSPRTGVVDDAPLSVDGIVTVTSS